MKKKFLFLSVITASLLLSGCSLTGINNKKNPMINATFIRTDDDSATWNPKVKIDDKKDITGVDVLSMAINPNDPNIIYLGTAANGLFVSKDGGETWSQQPFANKVYGLVFDSRNPDVMYGSGIFNGRAKIYKRLQEGQEWKDVYTEPSEGTTISSLAISRFNPQVLYAGISNGVIIKSIDGGQTWINLKIESNPGAPIVSIGFDSGNDQHVFFASFEQGVLETRDGGATIANVARQIDTVGFTSTVYTLVTDPYYSGVVYVGTSNGIFRRLPDGKWEPLNIIESSKAFPIRTIAINPKNSKEIIYSASKAIYKSSDVGSTWSTFQLDSAKDISVLKYDLNNPNRIYAGLRAF